MISTKQALLLLTLAAALACAASGQEVHVYHEKDLEALVDQPIPAGAELVGTFIYLGEPSKGFHTFTSFHITAGQIEFGNLLIIVSFPAGVPPKLKVGKAISPDAQNPLLLELVKRSPDGLFIIARATYSERL